MNQELDHEIKRALDELVQCAPPPPSGPGDVLRPLGSARSSRITRAVALAAVVLVVLAGGLALTSQRPTPDSLRTSGTIGGTESDTTVSSESDTTVSTDSISPVPSIAPTTTAEPATTTQPPTTSVGATAGPSGEYEIVAPTVMPGTTESPDGPVDTFDGIYFAYLHEGPLPEEPGSIRFDLVQAFSGEDCIVRFGAAAAQTCTPIGTPLDGPTARVDVQTDAVAVTIRGANSELTYRVSGAELLRLVNGQRPAAGAPVDFFAFTGGPFLLTFDQGTVIRIDQPS